MGLTTKKSGGTDFEPTPAGLHQAVCYGVVDIGTREKEYQGSKYDAREVLLLWELPGIRIEITKDGDTQDLPRAISKRYTNSLHSKANLCHDLETWRGQVFTDKELDGFDLKKLLGVNCQLNVIHRKKDDKVYANIGNIVPSNQKKKPENQTLFFSFEDFTLDNYEIGLPGNMPEWIQKLVMTCDEWIDLSMAAEDVDKRQTEKQEEVAGKPAENIEDDLPF